MNSPQGRAAFKQFQNAMSKVQTAGGGTGGSPKGAFAGLGGLLLLGGGALVVNSEYMDRLSSACPSADGFLDAIFNVDGGHRAIKYTRLGGVKTDIFNEGTHLLLPWFETAIDYDVRAKPRNVASLTGTKGGSSLRMLDVSLMSKIYKWSTLRAECCLVLTWPNFLRSTGL